MLLPGRHANTSDYRYGFQGQELDNEIKGEGNSINFKYRMHDPRVGRFFAVDPLSPQYAHYTPYSFSGNKVIAFKELEGLEESNTNEEISLEDANWFVKGMAIIFAKAADVGNEFNKSEVGHMMNAISGNELADDEFISGIQGFINLTEVATLPLSQLKISNVSSSKVTYKKDSPTIKVVKKNTVDNLTLSKVRVEKLKLPQVEVPEKPLTPATSLVPPTKRSVVEEFLKKDLGKTGFEAQGILNTIDFRKGVKKVVLNTGDRIWRFVTPGKENAPDQHFFTDAFGADSGPGGVGLTNGNKILIEYKVTSPTTVLQTKIKGTKQTQFISKDLINNVEELSRE